MAAFLARTRKAGFVFQVRDACPLALVYDGGLSRWSPVYFAFRLIEIVLYRMANRICATMPFLHSHVKNSGADPDKICWVPNGVNLANYEGWNQYDGGGDQLTAMYVGAFGVAHDAITIVRAAVELRRRGNHAYRFVFVGAGVKRRSCEEEARQHRLTNVEFRDAVDKRDVPQLQAQADILIASVTDSRSYEFGINLNKLYDYFASGRPVLFSGLAPNDPVKDSGAGYSVPPEDPLAMADALDRFAKLAVSERRALGALARDYAASAFDVRLHADRMEQLLRDAAAGVPATATVRSPA
jgi:glycosyltransferase involved in cell wall biosynthesis